MPPSGDDPAVVAAKSLPAKATEDAAPLPADELPGSDQPAPTMVGGKLGKEDYVAVSVDLSCVDLHFASDEGAKAAARGRVIQKAGASEEWLAFVAADLEAEGLTDPMTKKVAEAVEARCPGGRLTPELLDAATTEPAPATGDPAPADPKDDAAPADDPK